MLADYTITDDLLNLAIGIGDNPVTTNQARRHVAVIRNGDRVGEYVSMEMGLGLLVNVICRDLNSDVAAGFVHRLGFGVWAANEYSNVTRRAQGLHLRV